MSGWVLPEDIGRLIFSRYLFPKHQDGKVTLGEIATAKAFSATCREFYLITRDHVNCSIPLLLRALNPTIETVSLAEKYTMKDLTEACSPYESGLRYWTRKTPQLCVSTAIEESKVYTWSPRVVTLCTQKTAFNLVDTLEDCIGVFKERREGRTALIDHCISQMPNRMFFMLQQEDDAERMKIVKNYLVTTLLLCDDQQDMCSIRLKLKKKGLNFKDMQVMRFLFDLMKEYSLDQVISLMVGHVIRREITQTKGKPLAERTIKVAIDSGYKNLVVEFMQEQKKIHRKRELLFSCALKTNSVEMCRVVLDSPYEVTSRELKNRNLWEKEIGQRLDFPMANLLLEKGVLLGRVAVLEALHSSKEDEEVVGFLKAIGKIGVSFNLIDSKGRTPLHIAAIKDLNLCVKFLVGEGLEMDIRDRYGKNVTAYCSRNLKRVLSISKKSTQLSSCLSISRLVERA